MRVTHGVASKRRHKKVLKRAKGYWGKRSKIYRRAIETVRRALVYGYRDRRARRREFRSLWITRLNAAARERGLSYRELIHGLKVKNINLSRDILAKIAAEYPEAFDKIVEVVKNKN
ncbi:MAG: 50S ribosomal protein L20 [Candidatus Omnitrophica bacterium]|nr:50S ribosomal protein L20 [Candidatus Omnitrophota bacterium]